MKPKDFCKIFDSEEFGQILVVREVDDDDCEVIRFTVKVDKFGIDSYSASIGFGCREKADKAFVDTDKEKAVGFAEKMNKELQVIFDGG